MAGEGGGGGAGGNGNGAASSSSNNPWYNINFSDPVMAASAAIALALAAAGGYAINELGSGRWKLPSFAIPPATQQQQPPALQQQPGQDPNQPIILDAKAPAPPTMEQIQKELAELRAAQQNGHKSGVVGHTPSQPNVFLDGSNSIKVNLPGVTPVADPVALQQAAPAGPSMKIRVSDGRKNKN